MSNVIAMALAACLSVESSNGIDTRIGDGGRAVGVLQVHPVAVREANRVERIMARRQGRVAKKWTLADRRCPVNSAEMCRATLEWHYRRGVKCPVELACKWRNQYSRCPSWHRAKIEREIIK